MRKTTLVFAVAGIFAACSNEKKEEPKTAESIQTAVALPFTANYSSSFEMGNPAYSATILQGSWKDWQENKLDKTNWLADTVFAYLSDNSIVQGADSLMARWKRFRAEYSSVLDSIDAVIPVYSTDKKENWVLVWAREYNTKTDGTKDTIAVMETWRINKDGKADLLFQFDRQKRKQ